MSEAAYLKVLPNQGDLKFNLFWASLNRQPCIKRRFHKKSFVSDLRSFWGARVRRPSRQEFLAV
jgi:hypothetical protein